MSFGVASVDVDPRLRQSGFVALDDDQPAYGIDVGYALNRNLAVELGYQDLGEHRGTGFYCPPNVVCPLVVREAWADAEAWHLSVVPSFRAGRYLSPYVKLGVVRWRLEPRLRLGPQRVLPAVRETDFRGALGVRVALRERLDLTIDGAGFDDVRSYLLGLRFQF